MAARGQILIGINLSHLVSVCHQTHLFLFVTPTHCPHSFKDPSWCWLFRRTAEMTSTCEQAAILHTRKPETPQQASSSFASRFPSSGPSSDAKSEGSACASVAEKQKRFVCDL